MQSEFEKLAQQIRLARAPVFQHRIKTTPKPISAKTLEDLQRQFHGRIPNITLRNGWDEATKRKNYENEYDRLHGALHSALVKNPQAVGIEQLKIE